ncbi:sugar ABC transporter ATP-binding protein [Mesorhizobium sp. B3-1-7]|uniref:sugar ABC transporter ATP-binding protein n=1 Tax=Mesorhizobium sp. B3-1-7 TaxID=2589894 RepID=UPI00112E420A|nr:sugar ABC transporter ATP-binding protein [Mesorhizobium sp. B3-1-7]TPI59048.1 sugar ABC transporter ATP-binding protein [Mesorhizobium sp. B3-1-7]
MAEAAPDSVWVPCKAQMSDRPIISVHNLAKHYGGVIALDDMSLAVERGTIHAVVGENGAGKSTLMKVLAGVVRPDSGTIELDGTIVAIDGPNAARQHGIGMVYQELSLFPERSVLANLFVNREPVRRGLISNTVMEERCRPLLDELGLHVDVRAPVNRLSIGERQLVELCRVLLENPRLLILDEPNSALNQRETEKLFAVLKRIRERGITMIYVSHRLEEVFSICDRITITRNGRDVLTGDRSALTIPEVIEGMIGRQREALFPPALPARAGTAKEIAVSGLGGGRLRQIDFTARSGEVVGFAGLEGSGISDLLDILFGLRRARRGEVRFPDGRGLPKNPTDAARRNVCLVPADRRRNGLMLDKSILFNISNIVVGARDDGPSWFSPKVALGRAGRQIEALRIKGRPHALTNSLSGGNQQKVVIGKWLEIGPQVFLLDDPTRGVDVGAKREIYGLIRQMSADGGIVLFSSTELPELIGLCDRIVVVYQGRLAAIVSSGAMDSRSILHLVNTGEMPGRIRNPQQETNRA